MFPDAPNSAITVCFSAELLMMLSKILKQLRATTGAVLISQSQLLLSIVYCSIVLSAKPLKSE